jgi:hypothetical protein
MFPPRRESRCYLICSTVVRAPDAKSNPNAAAKASNAGASRGHASLENAMKKKKAAWFPRRPFLSYGSFTLTGDLRTSAPGGLSPGHILIGSRCVSGQSRTGARTVAVVSHLRKMTH